MSEFKSGFIALIGSPNVGKSTLLNALVGKKIAIVSKKPQTTRTRISGVITKMDYQMVFLDTPGIHEGKNMLDSYMAETVSAAVKDVDAILFIIDGKAGLRERDAETLEKLKKQKTPFMIAVNKSDAIDDRQLSEILDAIGEDIDVLPISAKNGDGTDELLVMLERYLQPGPKYYPDDMITDQPERTIVAEIIREKALKHLGKEVPHGVGVDIEKMFFDESKKLMNIDAVIFCEKDSHKGIIIGKGGSRLKKIATDARQDIAQLFGEKVFLQVWVKVKEDWRNKSSMLKILGYGDL